MSKRLPLNDRITPLHLLCIGSGVSVWTTRTFLVWSWERQYYRMAHMLPVGFSLLAPSGRSQRVRLWLYAIWCSESAGEPCRTASCFSDCLHADW